ncbi:LuxR C-terminal-related transcriptional regulator [Chloroflexus sp.]|uniref:LuxR C-terminal-related transcriptional regulator n=1 Tax=Chloroflexus sp. TaxID=1904827 RepID=UPI00260D7403|nr:LuxR C-terminal-related transcriptional regulator [uncultured Chloroflexus sp.]
MMPLVRTKLHPPELLPSFIARDRLREQLRAALHSRLVLISAPAGYGKTSLLAEWMAEARNEWSHIAWLSLDASDNDIRRLLMYLLAALENIPPERRDRLRAMIDTEAMDAEQWFAELLNDLAETAGSTAIVLDDYQTIDDGQIHQAIAFLVDHLPPRCRLIIATRSDPPLPLARWRARRYLAELRGFDLAFTPEEAAAFLLETMELSLSREQIVALIERTEGWPAGLQLTALALRSRADRGALIEELNTTNRYVVDYLLEDVFHHLPGHIQQFLLQTSILERLCGPLCDAVLGLSQSSDEGASGQSYSQLILTELERNNLFLVPLDAERTWYRYHHLFADVLRDRLVTGSNAEQLALLHRRAGAWFAAHGFLTEAINHALSAHAIDDVVAMLEPIGLALITQVGEVTLRRWLPAIPETAFESHPRLALLRAWLATSDYQAEEARYWIGVAEQALASVASGTAAPIGTIANLRGELSAARVRLAILQGNTEQAVAEGRQALAWLQPDQQALRMRIAKDLGYAYVAECDTVRAEKAFAEAIANGFNAGFPYISAMATSDYAYTLVLRGAINAAIKVCRETIDQLGQINRGQRPPGAGLPLLALADLHGIGYKFAGALPALAEAESIIKPGSTTSYLCLLIATARIAHVRADDVSALRAIRQARFLARERNVAWVMAVLDGLEAQILLAQSEIEAARLLLSDLPTTPAEFHYLPIAVFYAREHVTRAHYEWRLATARAAGDTDALRKLAAELTHKAGQELWQTLSPIDAALLRSLALAAAGDEAVPALTHALHLAASEGIVAPFVTAKTALQPILATLSSNRQLPPFGEYLLTLFTDDVPLAATPAPSLPLDSLPEPLSQREIEVLRLMAEGRTNQDIAGDLVIALSTVKSHINNIFSKLGVATRTQAVARGRRLGLIP